MLIHDNNIDNARVRARKRGDGGSATDVLLDPSGRTTDAHSRYTCEQWKATAHEVHEGGDRPSRNGSTALAACWSSCSNVVSSGTNTKVPGAIALVYGWVSGRHYFTADVRWFLGGARERVSESVTYKWHCEGKDEGRGTQAASSGGATIAKRKRRNTRSMVMHERATTRSWWHACGLGFMAAEERRGAEREERKEREKGRRRRRVI